MAFKTYHSPQSVQIGSTPITGVVSISCDEQQGEIHAAADGETHETVAAYTTKATRGSIALLDPAQAQAIAGSTGSLVFTWKDAAASPTNKTVTIAGAVLGGWSAVVSKDTPANASVPFMAPSSDGSTSPLSIA
jgi:hypothetical protein